MKEYGIVLDMDGCWNLCWGRDSQVKKVKGIRYNVYKYYVQFIIHIHSVEYQKCNLYQEMKRNAGNRTTRRIVVNQSMNLKLQKKRKSNILTMSFVFQIYW